MVVLEMLLLFVSVTYDNANSSRVCVVWGIHSPNFSILQH